MDIDTHTNEIHVLDVFRISLQVNIFRMPARPGRNKRHSGKKDGAVAAWSNVSWVIESQLHQLGQSRSRTIARRHFNAYHTATFASSCARAPAVVNWSPTQNALKWWCCLVLPYVIMSHAKNALKWWSCLVLPYVIIVFIR